MRRRCSTAFATRTLTGCCARLCEPLNTVRTRCAGSWPARYWPGRVRLRQAAMSNAYGEIFASGAEDVINVWDSRSERERTKETATARERVAHLRAADDADQQRDAQR